MKQVTAYQSENGNLHATREACAVDDLMSLFVKDNHGPMQSTDLKAIVRNRQKIIPILLQADGRTIPPLLDPQFFHLGDWECEQSPTKQCAYTGEIGFDACIFCGEPEERK